MTKDIARKLAHYLYASDEIMIDADAEVIGKTVVWVQAWVLVPVHDGDEINDGE